MTSDINKPQIRFYGFTDAWEREKIGNVIKTEPFKSYLAEPQFDGKFETVQQGDDPVVVYANGQPYKDYENVILFGDRTLSLYKPKMPFFVATDGIRIITSVDKTGSDYLYCLLEKYKPRSEGYKRYYSILADRNCYISDSTEEQEKIGAFFKNLDSLIKLHECKLRNLQKIKKAMLEKMFV